MPVVLKPDSAGSLVLKFWKWQSKEKINDENYNHFSLKRMINFETDAKPNLNNGESKSKDLENEMLVDGGSGFQRFKRSTNGHYRSSAIKDRKESGDPYLHIISETILSVSFNGSHPVVRNVTQNKIVQICKKLDTCKPDVQEQELSRKFNIYRNKKKKKEISFM